ncbi:hypothetical protein DICPUDRAFT_36380 [Dictyostelium purpureum]|uniref:Checkpoint protein n=1 Tax=Dictyostelium purpureum TaxID=5786 RepID=F0ZQY5_DICPU|nr:uncharacterized protein DICPUDRAFT_36380 [Dictyostelium purpureum]EGC33662.1 hypothetical protein DICPUDRAFT_36380 [Dictyostelium purpureum]|eukprot:XP_003289832.1 hypothetical protein DICPUDRAFT_36380 [Dictyostelium purpureum]
MKFKAKVYKPNILLKTVQNIMKIHNDGICHITPHKLRFIIQSEINDGMQVFCEIQREQVFENFIIESLSDNEIQFQLDLEHLRRALQSSTSQSPCDVFVNLTKKGDNPILHFVIQSSSSSIMLVQDVPIVLLTAQQMAQINEPILPDPVVHILMPNLKNVQKVVDKMKNISELLKITVSMNHRLSFAVETGNGSISTFYNGLEHPQFEKNISSEPERSHSVNVDIKKFGKVLHIHQLSPSEVVLCLYERSIIVHVVLTGIMITYYIPVVFRN